MADPTPKPETQLANLQAQLRVVASELAEYAKQDFSQGRKRNIIPFELNRLSAQLNTIAVQLAFMSNKPQDGQN